MKLFIPQKIFVEKRAQNFSRTETILSNLKGIPFEVVEDTPKLIAQIKGETDPVGAGKKYLLLAYDPGRAFKPFPESEHYLSCDYFTLHSEEGCDMECSYCILQAYLTNPLITVYVNLEEMLEGLDAILAANPDRFFRIGTGQLADSLSLDHFTEFTETLVPYFAKKENALLELKTKSTNIRRLLPLVSEDKTLVSWSLNSHKIQKEEEHKTASIHERLGAAQAVIQAGYRVGFHFDPIIDYAGWENDYEEVIAELFQKISGKSIAWISLGCLRMMKELKPMMQERFPKSDLPLAEWIRGMDGKLRYFKPRRIEMYRKIVTLLRQYGGDHLTLYLSMESPEVWEKVFGERASKETVCRLLDLTGRGNWAGHRGR